MAAKPKALGYDFQLNRNTPQAWLVTILFLVGICGAAFYIRLHAVFVYGRVIHEYDPWFNYRATEYLVQHGLEKFLTWFDDMSWWPIGRPVGTTVYPGMMMTSAGIYKALKYFEFNVTVNDVCVFLPAFFGALTTLFTYGLAKETFRNTTAALFAAGIMAIIPAHLMRSVAGGYDNEAVAVAAIVGTFYFWVRSLRTDSSYPFGFLAALSYIYMAAAWGGYTFVCNMVGLHAGLLVLLGQFSKSLYRSYTIYFILGTWGAMQVPIVGWAPLQSMEQMMPMAVFWVLQVCQLLEFVRPHLPPVNFVGFQLGVLASCVALIGMGLIYLSSIGMLGSFSTRVRSLFIPHTKTGNPLVDSVAEHQATPPEFYFRYFHLICYLWPVGFSRLLNEKSAAGYFTLFYTLVSAYFSQKMVRLVLLLSPAASILGGMAMYAALEWSFREVTAEDQAAKEAKDAQAAKEAKEKETTAAAAVASKEKEQAKDAPTPAPAKQGGVTKRNPKSPEPKNKAATPAVTPEPTNRPRKPSPPLIQTQRKRPTADQPAPWEGSEYQPMRRGAALFVIVFLVLGGFRFTSDCFTMATYLSEPQIIMRGNQNGETVVFDDFRQAYWWLRDNTPENARVMAWWDYGYQINGVANRTTIADGNTWNHEHIALLGKCLVSGEQEAHGIARHLADYVLVWTTRFIGVYRDDIAKMPHMARIAGSVYPEVEPREYFVDKEGKGSTLAQNSLLYKLTYFQRERDHGNSIQLKHFQNVYDSPHGMVRIYKVLDVAKRHPFGSYAPELKLGQFRPPQ